MLKPVLRPIGIPPDRPKIQHRHRRILFATVRNMGRQRTDQSPLDEERDGDIQPEPTPVIGLIPAGNVVAGVTSDHRQAWIVIDWQFK